MAPSVLKQGCWVCVEGLPSLLIEFCPVGASLYLDDLAEVTVMTSISQRAQSKASE